LGKFYFWQILVASRARKFFWCRPTCFSIFTGSASVEHGVLSYCPTVRLPKHWIFGVFGHFCLFFLQNVQYKYTKKYRPYGAGLVILDYLLQKFRPYGAVSNLITKANSKI